MEIKFRLVRETEVEIISEGKVIGRIFTPSSSGDDITNAIQVCGFEEAFDLWGCGIFRDIKTGKAKKDIQLRFSTYNTMKPHEAVRTSTRNCERCFNNPCNCETPKEEKNPFIVYRAENCVLEKRVK